MKEGRTIFQLSAAIAVKFGLKIVNDWGSVIIRVYNNYKVEIT